MELNFLSKQIAGHLSGSWDDAQEKQHKAGEFINYL